MPNYNLLAQLGGEIFKGESQKKETSSKTHVFGSWEGVVEKEEGEGVAMELKS